MSEYSQMLHSLLVWTAWLGLFWVLMYCGGLEIDEQRLYDYNSITDFGQEPIPADELAEMLAS